MNDDRGSPKHHHSFREGERKMSKFSSGDPAVVTTDRKLSGLVEIVDRESELSLEFVPQSFRGQKGWIDFPSVVGPDSNWFLFYVQDGSRPMRVKKFEGANYDWSVAIEEQVESRFGSLTLGDDDLALDPKPVGSYDDLPLGIYIWHGVPAGNDDPAWFLKGSLMLLKELLWLLKAREATLAPELYVAGLREHSPQMSVEKIQESLEGVTAEWDRFQDGDDHPVQDYIRAHIAGTLLDWTHVLRAVEQAERGDSTAFVDLIRRAHVDPSILHQFRSEASHILAVSEPLNARWK